MRTIVPIASSRNVRSEYAGVRHRPRYVWLTPEAASVHIHGLTSLVGMLRTVQHNILCGDERATLLERAALTQSTERRSLDTRPACYAS